MKNSYVSWLFLQKNADILFDKRKTIKLSFLAILTFVVLTYGGIFFTSGHACPADK